MMTPQPSVGEAVAITATDNEPLLLVSTVSGVLLTDLATEALHRLHATEPDTATRRDIRHADDRMSFCRRPFQIVDAGFRLRHGTILLVKL
ncbi:hypothetical protein GCM10009067_31930 [Haloarcula sebkhae]|uniref:Uncharacterized protein n=1 Tax=Haloarcula sebkhae TaxID=932660 RepID=A0A830EUF8_9EURY|nr:hypothetical protein GCM10009067_31930 [Haloarcula sebkhae]